MPHTTEQRIDFARGFEELDDAACLLTLPALQACG